MTEIRKNQSNNGSLKDGGHPNNGRRNIVAGLVGGGLLAGGSGLAVKWTKPVIETVIVPAHADTSDQPESDNRLKKSVEKIATIGGVTFYRWRWNRLAEKTCGLTGAAAGVIAQEVAVKFPEVVGSRGEFMTVNYRRLLQLLTR